MGNGKNMGTTILGNQTQKNCKSQLQWVYVRIYRGMDHVDTTIFLERDYRRGSFVHSFVTTSR